MAEHSVDDHPDTQLFGGGAQGTEILLVAQQGVDLGIVRRVVAVIGMGLENGIAVDAGDSQTLEIGQFLLNAFQVAAEKVGVGDLTLSVGCPVRLSFPVFVVGPAGGDVFLGSAGLVEPVREDLVHYAAFQPVRGFKFFLVHRELPLIVAAEDAVPGKPFGQPLTAPVGADLKMVEIEPGLIRGKVTFPPLLVAAVHAAPEQVQHL